MDESCGSRLTSLSRTNPWEDDVKFLEILKDLRVVLLEQVGFQKRSWCTYTSPCIVLQSRMAARLSSAARKSKGLTGNVGRSRADRQFRIIKVFCIWQGFFCKSWIWVKSWLTVVGFLSCCMDNSSILACLSRSVSSQQILRCLALVL